MSCKGKYNSKEVQSCIKNLSSHERNLIVRKATEFHKSECKKILCITGHYFLNTNPENIDLASIKKIQKFLFNLRKQAVAWQWSTDDVIKDALGIATSLSSMVDFYIREGYHHQKFSSLVEDLGDLLKIIGND